MRNIAEGLVYVALGVMLYVNWTSMGVDNERRALNKIRNTQGMVTKIGVEK
jgi:hypothetical protein